eukprot:5763679-Amphidinium_carterae.1
MPPAAKRHKNAKHQAEPELPVTGEGPPDRYAPAAAALNENHMIAVNDALCTIQAALPGPFH